MYFMKRMIIFTSKLLGRNNNGSEKNATLSRLRRFLLNQWDFVGVSVDERV